MLNLRKLLGIAPKQQKPLREYAKPITAPSQKDFPGRTNYGVPQDNMIDTPGGYITRQQYDKNLMTNGYLRGAIHEDEGFVGTSRNLNQMSPANADIRNFSQMAEDDYVAGPQFSRINQDIRNWRQQRPLAPSPTSAMQGGWQPVDMDTVPTNFTRGRTGYYQGSNPFINSLNDDYNLRVR